MRGSSHRVSVPFITATSTSMSSTSVLSESTQVSARTPSQKENMAARPMPRNGTAANSSREPFTALIMSSDETAYSVPPSVAHRLIGGDPSGIRERKSSEVRSEPFDTPTLNRIRTCVNTRAIALHVRLEPLEYKQADVLGQPDVTQSVRDSTHDACRVEPAPEEHCLSPAVALAYRPRRMLSHGHVDEARNGPRHGFLGVRNIHTQASWTIKGNAGAVTTLGEGIPDAVR
eukprot:scaffold64758_cov31-Tisochrysis_lutea.AAC.3